jgi:hypothetical protein
MNEDHQAPTTSTEWYFIEEEEKFDQLFESLNLKGTREKKLQEGLKKIKSTIKLKKPKKLVRNDLEEVEGKEGAEKEGEDVEMADDNDSKQQEAAKGNDD